MIPVAPTLVGWGPETLGQGTAGHGPRAVIEAIYTNVNGLGLDGGSMLALLLCVFLDESVYALWNSVGLGNLIVFIARLA
jgi:hypothetical protein